MRDAIAVRILFSAFFADLPDANFPDFFDRVWLRCDRPQLNDVLNDVHAAARGKQLLLLVDEAVNTGHAPAVRSAIHGWAVGQKGRIVMTSFEPSELPELALGSNVVTTVAPRTTSGAPSTTPMVWIGLRPSGPVATKLLAAIPWLTDHELHVTMATLLVDAVGSCWRWRRLVFEALKNDRPAAGVLFKQLGDQGQSNLLNPTSGPLFGLTFVAELIRPLKIEVDTDIAVGIPELIRLGVLRQEISLLHKPTFIGEYPAHFFVLRGILANDVGIVGCVPQVPKVPLVILKYWLALPDVENTRTGDLVKRLLYAGELFTTKASTEAWLAFEHVGAAWATLFLHCAFESPNIAGIAITDVGKTSSGNATLFPGFKLEAAAPQEAAAVASAVATATAAETAATGGGNKPRRNAKAQQLVAAPPVVSPSNKPTEAPRLYGLNKQLLTMDGKPARDVCAIGSPGRLVPGSVVKAFTGERAFDFLVVLHSSLVLVQSKLYSEALNRGSTGDLFVAVNHLAVFRGVLWLHGDRTEARVAQELGLPEFQEEQVVFVAFAPLGVCNGPAGASSVVHASSSHC